MLLPDLGSWRAGYLYMLPAVCIAVHQFLDELPLKQSRTEQSWQRRNMITN